MSSIGKQRVSPDGGTNGARSVVALTGGTGFVGGTLIRHLLESGLEVRALARSYRRRQPADAAGLTWIAGDLHDPAALSELAAGTDAFIHCAGTVRGGGLEDFRPVNVEGVRSVVDAVASASPAARLVLVSSLAAREPGLSPYAASKHLGEQVLSQEGRGLEWVILRPPAVYGPGDQELRPLLQWLKRGLQFRPAGASGRFSLIYVADLAAALERCAFHPELRGGPCFELHDGHEGGYAWEDLAAIAEGLYRRRIRPIPVSGALIRAAAGTNLLLSRTLGYRPMLTPGKVRELLHSDWSCSNAELTAATGWRPRVDFAAGLRRTLDEEVDRE